MAFGATLTLPAITGSHTDFPVLLKTADFPATSIDGGANSIANGGGDLVAYTSSAKTTQLPLDVVTFVAGGTPQVIVYTKLPAAATSSTIYIEASTVQTVQPAVTATYGRNAVWADYESVLHLIESGNGTSGEFVDSSGNGVTGKVGRSTSIQTTTGHPWGGNWQQLDGVNDYILIENSGNLLDNSDITVQALWQNLAILGNTDEGLIGNWEIAQSANHFRISPQDDGTNGVAYGLNDGTGDNNLKGAVPAVNDVTYMHMTAESAALRGYENGSQAAVDTSIAGDNQFVTSKLIKIGTYYDLSTGRSLKCRVGNVRLRKSVLSADWISTEYANQNSTAAWVSVGTWADGGGVTLFDGAASGASSVSGSITTSIQLDGLISGLTNASGDITTAIQFESSCFGSSSLSASLSTDIELSASALGSAFSTGTLEENSSLFAGGISSSASVAGSIQTEIHFSSSCFGSAGLTGTLALDVDVFVGGVVGQAAANGDLETVISLDGACIGAGIIAGAFTEEILLSGSLAGLSSIEGVFDTSINLLAAASGFAFVAANLLSIDDNSSSIRRLTVPAEVRRVSVPVETRRVSVPVG